MSSDYNANLFELKKYRPISVSIYQPEIIPFPKETPVFFQILGRIAKKLTRELATAVISERRSIIVLESSIPKNLLKIKEEVSNIGNFEINLKLLEEKNIIFRESPLEYGRLVSKIVDLALVHFSDDYYKYSERSPIILERGEGYFDERLRNQIGIEDGREYYRGIRVINGVPHLLINRRIELRSKDNLLEELKILAHWWAFRNNKTEIDFYAPPKEFIKFINWIFRNRTANVKAYESRRIRIKEITWEVRAKDKVLDNNTSPYEYHKKMQNLEIEDINQPLIIWELNTKDGESKLLYHIPEFLVVGHNLKDLSMRVSKTRISQVFDIIQPHCGDQLRKIIDIIQKIDTILRNDYNIVYPDKIEFSILPRNINDIIIAPNPIKIKFKNREIDIEPPYGINFYKKYTKSNKYIKPIPKENIKILIVCEDEYHEFLNELIDDIKNRNDCKIHVDKIKEINLDNFIYTEYDLIITINEEEPLHYKYKQVIIGTNGIAHQNILPQNTVKKAIPQLTMQITLKLGGIPWYVSNVEKIDILSLYSYKNPFSGIRFYLYNLMTSSGELIFQSKPYKPNQIQKFIINILETIEKYQRILILTSYLEPSLKEVIMEEFTKLNIEYIILQIFQHDDLRLFHTYVPRVVSTLRRRRRVKPLAYPIESYEHSPQGTILKASKSEYYLLPTASTKIKTYYRGCPTTVKIRIVGRKDFNNIEGILHLILSLSLAAGTSGHVTRLPAPLYYLRKYSEYLNKYQLPSIEKVYETFFYV